MNEGYKGKVRSLTLNLKSKSNPDLRESVVSGELSVDKLCRMSVEVKKENIIWFNQLDPKFFDR